MPYPRVASDADAHCYVCKGPLVKAGLSGYPAGSGGRVGFCVKCNQKTWYDLKEREAAQTGPTLYEIHEQIAKALGWTIEDARSFSLQTLRDWVRPVDSKLAAEISEAIRSGRYYITEA